MDGIIAINKATGMTSHDVVARVRKLLKQKRVGHTGTLDPAASGVLPICVGQATRVAEYLSGSGKAYQAEITFGVVTDTYDAEGTIVRTGDASGLVLAQITEALPHFLGPQMQRPPCYSAIKIQGQPAYKLMRLGEEVTLATRPIEIFQLQVVAWQPPTLTLAIECSKGTYIRSLAYDLGEQLGCGAYLTALCRTRSGPFQLAESVTLEQLAEAIVQHTVQQHVFSADYVLHDYPALTLDAATIERVLHGNSFPHQGSFTEPLVDLARIYDTDGHFLAIATWDERQHSWQPKKVFSWSAPDGTAS
ncbi:MAG: tRNA pseudouridine(55) synthase TruB [Chloroflexi bacterium]|nr:MAG: tRNA pseudouridine(55) synthase TruB [Chloroflexota bacterium]